MRKVLIPLVVLIAPILLTCSQPAPAPSPQTCAIDSTIHNTQATWYTKNPNEVGACSFALNAGAPGTIGAAIADPIFAGSEGCGLCFELTGAAAKLTVQVADYCPTCLPTSIFDLMDTTLATLTGEPPGMGPVTYRQVNCPISGNVRIESDAGTNPYYLKARVFNHRYAVKKMELMIGRSYQAMTRSTDNAFDISPGVRIPSPIGLRITDLFGHVIEESVVVSPGHQVDGKNQFPACP